MPNKADYPKGFSRWQSPTPKLFKPSEKYTKFIEEDSIEIYDGNTINLKDYQEYECAKFIKYYSDDTYYIVFGKEIEELNANYQFELEDWESDQIRYNRELKEWTSHKQRWEAEELKELHERENKKDLEEFERLKRKFESK